MIPFNFHHLYYFYVIANEGSVLRAAEKLRLAQPTLSTQLKQFEEFLEKKLFERDGRKLILTEDGHYVLSYAKMIFDLGQEFMDGLNDASQKGRIKIQVGATSSVPRSFVDALLQFLLKIDPSVYITVIEDNIEKLTQFLKEHFLDVVLTDVPSHLSTESEIQGNLVGTVPVVFCAHPTLARKYRRFPHDLNGAPMIFPTAQSQLYHSLHEYLLKHKVTPKVVAEIQDVELVRRLVLAGFGIALMNRYTILKAPAKDKLVILDRKTEHAIYDKIYILFQKRKRPHLLVQKIVSDFQLH